MDKPLVSVGMPVYNSEAYIKDSLESILNQTYSNLQIVIVDDRSTDGTYNILKKYQKKDKRIELYRNKTNLYFAENRNKVLQYCKGKYLVWQDADDISLPDRVQKQVYFMDNNPEVGICGGWLESFKEAFFPFYKEVLNKVF